ncbi:MAG: hypothetical protein RLZZ108_442 [Actinomycetota bacterium]
MITVGVDLAAEPKGTAVARIEWSGARAKLTALSVGADDGRVIDLSNGADKIGIDCPLGWPEDFVSFLVEHQSGKLRASEQVGNIDWRRNLSFRETDRNVRAIIGRWPLSVSTDRIGVTALRCAGLLARLAEAGHNVDRSGLGDVAEVYPGGSLRIWGLHAPGYRTSEEIRLQLIERLQAKTPWLELGQARNLMIESCDAFDAVVASLSARAATIGGALLPSEDQLAKARVEGWILLPSVDLENLRG